ncbi:dTDP-4-dehydrorhamnose reductase [Marininema halotolerans]|uniref:dTDP-4-dehydrorhamnose reductase n=1 Tax=Marininema halotolerans TaxID=1155944 RepID=A0A1I6R8C2_9BACL|nr:dTDP-4-dehydrorhamnose reductase [Marininema halotolerans]SFS60780.1 dTDP-4-dehydrorhamnose reductase [Marininema halotolerans]
MVSATVGERRGQRIMKVWVTGAGGQLGKDMVRILGTSHQTVGFSRLGWDVAQSGISQKLLAMDPPDVVIHCAAFTQVDGSEENQREAFRVNTWGTHQLAQSCRVLGIRLVYISTDYVFSGEKAIGYVESDWPAPINVYGKTKAMGENWVRKRCPNHLILRTAWVYGHGGSNFPKGIMQRAKQGEVVRVVDDQRGSPTYTVHLAEKTKELIESPLTGTFHIAGSGDCTWYEFASEIFRYAGYSPASLVRISSQELDRKAKRPSISILRTERLPEKGVDPLTHWKVGLDDFFAEKAVVKDD